MMRTFLRRSTFLGALLGLALLSTGCIMVFAVDEPVTTVCGQKKIVEIDDQLYLLDLKTNRIRKIDKQSVVQSETTITTETSDDD